MKSLNFERTGKEKNLCLRNNGNGYLFVSLYKKGKEKQVYVHRLVAETFIENPKKKREVNHLDYNTKNNCVNNLAWATPEENTNYSLCNRPKHNKCKTNTGERYITYRKSRNSFRVVFNKKEWQFKNIEDAIRKRDEILKNEQILN